MKKMKNKKIKIKSKIKRKLKNENRIFKKINRGQKLPLKKIKNKLKLKKWKDKKIETFFLVVDQNSHSSTMYCNFQTWLDLQA